MRITAGHNFGEELRFPDLLRGLLRRDRLGRAARDREVVDWHSPPPALVRQVEPPRVIAPGTGATAFVLADLANSHASSFCLRRARGCAASNPIEHVMWMEPPSSNAEALRDE